MKNYLKNHPILEIPDYKTVDFYYENLRYQAMQGAMISSALIANGVYVMGYHPKDHRAQGIFCANGQCSQCLIMADGVPVKSCITEIKSGMKLERLEQFPPLDHIPASLGNFKPPIQEDCDVLIIGGGPAGLSAALFMSDFPYHIILVDDKPELGGKLTLQTHQFFGSIEDCYAGTRGFEIAHQLTRALQAKSNVKVHNQTTAIGIFEDHKVGIITPHGYLQIKPKIILNATGAREKMLSFPGSYLPNIYGAGAFQTLVNRDFLKPAQRILVVGGGNVGLIAAYHAVQAGIQVAAVIEALPQVSGYCVHRDKIARLGIPILTSHTLLECNGHEQVESAWIAQINHQFKLIAGSEKLLLVDAVLIGVGLTPIDELVKKAHQIGIPCYQAGDAQEIAEASAAFFGGKIAASKILYELSGTSPYSPEWETKMNILKSKPGQCTKLHYPNQITHKFLPVLHCYQCIPCNPCSTICPHHVIYIPEDNILEIPQLVDNICIGCFQCVLKCPGLAISLIKNDNGRYFSYLAFELDPEMLTPGQTLQLTDWKGEKIGSGILNRLFQRPGDSKRYLLEIKTESATAIRAAGIRLFDPKPDFLLPPPKLQTNQPDYICRCEHVTRQEIEAMIDQGIRDINLMKSIHRVTMGGCGGKSCQERIIAIMKEKGLQPETIIPSTVRPFLSEVKLKDLADYQA